MINEKVQNGISNALLVALLFSSFLLPSIQIFSGFPKIHLTDILLPLFLIVVLMNFRLEIVSVAKGFIIANCLLAFIAVISLLVNHRLSVLRDDFEIMKMAKFVIVFLFVMVTVAKTDFVKMLRIIFVLVVIFNFLHYINFLGFNQIVTKYYGSDVQVDTFGLNSLGQPDTKRIIGTVGNPNNNAILFLFFVIFFFPELKSTWKERIYFLVAVFGLLACQSRTGFIAFGIVFLFGSVIKKYNLKTAVLYLLSFVGMFVLLMLMGNIYLNSLAGNIMKQHSLRSRLETWSMLWEMIKQKPLLGYSPFKDYFDNNHIYSESEYFLHAWRYGFLGLGAYLMILGSAFYASFKARFTKSGFFLSLFTIVIIVTALTNNPLSDTLIYMMYAFCAGLFFSDKMKGRRIMS